MKRTRVTLPSIRLRMLAFLCVGSACSSSFNPFPAPDAATVDVPSDVPSVCPPLRCDSDIRQWFTDSCGTSTCHGEGTVYPDANLESGDVFARLLNLPAGGRAGIQEQCGDIPVIDPVDPQNSMLLRKLRATQGQCGDRMPFDGVASTSEIECVESWIERELCLRAGTDAGPRIDAGARDAGPAPDAGPISPPDPSRDPRPLTQEEADCLEITNSACVACHQIEDRYYAAPYWAPPHPYDFDTPSLDECDVPTNSLSEEARECFGLSGVCLDCHTAEDGNVYLRPWNGTTAPPVTTDPTCYELL